MYGLRRYNEVMRHLFLCVSLLSLVSANYLRRWSALETGSEDQRNALTNSQRLAGWSTDEANLQPLKLDLRSPNGMQYLADVTIGGQTLSALYDTGSFDIITVNDLCDACKVPPELKLYRNTTSGTFEKGNSSLTGHWFAGGLLWAKQDFDKIHVGVANSFISVQLMPFLQVVHTDIRMWTENRSHFTTYVGLGHTDIVPGHSKTETQFKSLLELTGTQRFAICLDSEKTDTGHLTFNPTYSHLTAGFAATFKSVPVIGKSHWAVAVNSISYQNGVSKETRCAGDHRCIAIVDSGTSMIGLPSSQFPFVNRLIERVKSDCSNLDDLPDLVFELGQHKFALPPSAYVLRASWSDSYCYPAFLDFSMPSDNGDVWILGVPFLRHFYTVFDREALAIHIAEQGDGCEPIVPVQVANSSLVQPIGLAAKTRGLHPAVANIHEASGPSWERPREYLTV
jgi:cathepsin D